VPNNSGVPNPQPLQPDKQGRVVQYNSSPLPWISAPRRHSLRLSFPTAKSTRWMGAKAKVERLREGMGKKKPEVGGVRRPVPGEPHARHLRAALPALAPAGGGPREQEEHHQRERRGREARGWRCWCWWWSPRPLLAHEKGRGAGKQGAGENGWTRGEGRCASEGKGREALLACLRRGEERRGSRGVDENDRRPRMTWRGAATGRTRTRSTPRHPGRALLRLLSCPVPHGHDSRPHQAPPPSPRR
jgi:hypothetical protein